MRGRRCLVSLRTLSSYRLAARLSTQMRREYRLIRLPGVAADPSLRLDPSLPVAPTAARTMGTWVGSVALRLAEIATVEAANPLSEGAVRARLQCPLRGAGGRGGAAF